MRKLSIIALAALLVVAFTLPASAIENIFGGYWRTRMYSQTDFSGDDTESKDLQQVDTRTRLFYTAKFSDNLKLVNKFEMDAVWGDNAQDSGYGDIGADGVRIEVKNSYADFNLGDMVNAAVGVQGYVISKGFLFDDDAAGVKLTFKAGMADIPIWWIKFNEDGYQLADETDDVNEGDVDGFVLYPSIKIADGMTLKPHVAWFTSENINEYARVTLGTGYESLDIYTVGLEFDGKVGPAAFGLTGIYEAGTLEGSADAELDLSAYLLDATVGMDFGPVNVHMEGIYASGDDNDDDDVEYFVNIPGVCHYWAEIMGQGVFDNQVSNGSPGEKITNLMAGNMGVSAKVMEKVKLSLDLWYALLAEENEAGDDELGTEVDFRATIPVVDKLNLDLVAAYLFAGDVTGDEDPIEMGAQLSLAF